MSAYHPVLIEHLPGRSPGLRASGWIVLAAFPLGLLVGCHGIGSSTKSPGASDRVIQSAAKRKSESEKTAESLTKGLTRKEPLADRQSKNDVRPAAAFDSKSDPIPRASLADDDEASETIVQTASQRLLNSDDDGSFIKILTFNDESKVDESTPTVDTGNPTDSGEDPPQLPPTPLERHSSLRLTFPSEIPGADSPSISLPVSDLDHPERKIKAINKLFPPATPARKIEMPTDRVMTLEELEDLAMANSPIIAQALAAITMNQGAVVQAGVYPNPVFGYEADTVGSSYTRNYQGTYLAQTIKTAGKLPLARAAANMDLMNSQLAYERTRQQILHDVRTGYFNVLVSQEAIRINGALVSFTNQVYAIMINRLKNGEQAGYELAQLRTLVKQAQTTLVNSQNRYISAWKQLAVATGVPELPLAQLEGRVDMPVPNLDYDALLERVLSVHPDLQASRNLEAQAKLQLRLQRAIPIPDPTVAGVFQNDSTTPGYQRTSYNLNISFPVPLFDRNQGNIRSALGKLEMNSRQYAVATNSLTSQLADAFERYQNGRFQSEYYRTQILPDLARAYRGVYDRHMDNSEKVAFGDIIVAQQNLAGGVSSYITSLWTQWNAAVDIANLMQLSDFRSLFSDLPPGPDTPNTPTLNDTPVEGGQP